VKVTAFQRRALLAGALIATVAAAVIPAEPDEAPVAERRAETARPPRENAGARLNTAEKSAAPLPELPLERLEQRGSREAVRDAFEARSWAPPPPKPAPPPPPQAPPLPFKYMGKIMDGGQVVVFLIKQDKNYVVRAGDKLDNDYQVEEINPGLMTLTYLPLGQKQTIAIGAAN
jgi:hypothetical protein